MNKNGLFTIRQIANACGISRATVLRMEAEGLLQPALKEASGYRYYDTDNVLRAMQVNTMHRMGLKRKEIHPLTDDPGDIDAVIERLEHLRDNIDTIVTSLKKRTMQDNRTALEQMHLPETLCYIRTYDVEGSRYDLDEHLRAAFEGAIKDGCQLDWEREPFLRVHRPDIVAGRFVPGLYQYYVCIPITRAPRACRHADTVRARNILSFTWYGRVTNLPDRTLTLAQEARDRGLTPTGWFHVLLAFYNAGETVRMNESQLLQLGCIVE
ncbi:MAG: MerR family transcriptional regulator [Clostridia bacterium]|nr:MerR family transcriptional regulator [Clostridia bacterium]